MKILRNILIVLFILLAIFVGLFYVFCNFTNDVINIVNTEINATPQPTLEYILGDVAILGNASVSVSEVAWSKPQPWETVEEGFEIYGIYVSITNNFAQEKMFSEYDFQLYADNISCSRYYTNPSMGIATITSKRSLNGWIYFEAPKNAKALELEYVYDYNDSKAVFHLQ